MQLKVDSAEPLENVLLVVGAMYGVELAVAGNSGRLSVAKKAPATRKAAGKRVRRTARNAAAPTGGGRRGRKRAVDSADVRAWARANGHPVKNRGRVPAAVVDAYRTSGSAG
jgi:hypothetical protein